MNTESCDMVRVERHESIWDLKEGEFHFSVDEHGQRFFVCMLPGQTACSIPIRPVVTPGLNGGHSWEWDGNEDKPTLMPSINATGSWHGWVRAGRMVSC
jgi:hypothetical protein